MPAPDEFPITVIMEQGRVARAGWSLPSWKLIGVVAGRGEARDTTPQIIHAEGDTRQLLWPGLRLQLHRDAAESYWHNLVGRKPSLFVICEPDPDTGLRPARVTANYDEAGAYMETDGQVFSAPIPPEIYRFLEEYVMTHYSPEEGKQRKRKGWKHETSEGPRPRAGRAARRG